MRPPITNEWFSLRFVSRKAVHFVRAAFGEKKYFFLKTKWIAFTVSESVVFVRLRYHGDGGIIWFVMFPQRVSSSA